MGVFSLMGAKAGADTTGSAKTRSICALAVVTWNVTLCVGAIAPTLRTQWVWNVLFAVMVMFTTPGAAILSTVRFPLVLVIVPVVDRMIGAAVSSVSVSVAVDGHCTSNSAESPMVASSMSR